jgi:hypothetical protein
MKMRELELIKEHSIEFGPQEVWLWELLYIYIYTYVYIYIYTYVYIYIYSDTLMLSRFRGRQNEFKI